MVATIERPGVQVIQEFRTTTPTIFVPALPACVLGPCFQVVEAVQDDGSLNPDAQVTTPARLVFAYKAATYTAVGGLILALSVNNAAAVSVTLPTGPNLTPTQVANAINAALIPGLVAEVETSGGNSRVVLRTTAEGENASIEIGTATAAGLLTEFAITVGYRAVGFGGYINYLDLDLQQIDYPDPRSNIANLTIDYDTVRVFINNGAGNVVEVLRTETFLDGASSAVSVFNDGDGDNLSPYLEFAGAEFAARNAQLVGTVDWTTLTYPGDFGVFTLEVYVDGVLNTVTFANPASAAAAITQLNAGLAGATAVLNSSNQPVITSSTSGIGGSIQIGTGGTINETLIGLAVSRYGAPKPSFARAQGITDLTAVTYATQVQGRTLRMSLDGDNWQQITFGAGVISAATLVSAINALWGAGVAAVSVEGSSSLVLKSVTTVGGLLIRGEESVVRIDKTASDATLLAAIGLTGAGAPFGLAGTGTAAVWGTPYAPVVGDTVWVNGLLLGEIVEIPVTPTNRLKISVEQLLTYTGSSWYIVAKGLDNTLWTATRPSTDLYIDENTGTLRVKHELFRDSAGVPTLAGPLNTYLAYTALRKDVTPSVDDFNLLRIGSVTDLETQLSPVDTQNPLALGMYFAILNAPSLEVTGCGVDETSDTEPDGTLDGYTRSLEFLESKDIYAIAPLTHSNDVGAVAQVHVDAMSEPANGLERIVLLNPTRPTRKSDTLIASGALGNVTGAGDDLTTGIANLQALLAAAGYPGPYNTTTAITSPVYVEFEDDTNKYPVESVSGGVVTINDGNFTAGNDDDFYFDAAGGNVFSGAIVDRPFTVKVRGGVLANRTEEATAYADIARGYADRRVIATAPDHAKATIDGLETLIDGYYLAAGLAGRISAKLPQQPLTEASITGFTGVVGSQDRYSEAQLQILSGGGLFVFYQSAPGQPVRVRHQLTTDMSTVQKRELSITTALDFASKMIRASLRNFIGQFNITTTVQDAITSAMEGIRSFLLRLGVFDSFEVNAIRQSAEDPTRLELDVTVGVFYPLNYIQVTLVI